MKKIYRIDGETWRLKKEHKGLPIFVNDKDYVLIPKFDESKDKTYKSILKRSKNEGWLNEYYYYLNCRKDARNAVFFAHRIAYGYELEDTEDNMEFIDASTDGILEWSQNLWRSMEGGEAYIIDEMDDFEEDEKELNLFLSIATGFYLSDDYFTCVFELKNDKKSVLILAKTREELCEIIRNNKDDYEIEHFYTSYEINEGDI